MCVQRPLFQTAHYSVLRNSIPSPVFRLTEGEQTLSVNATLVETLLDCLLEDWTCEAVREYVVGELANIVRAIFSVAVVVVAVDGIIPRLYVVLIDFRTSFLVISRGFARNGTL